jgi:aminoglycoside 3-N-acetyltransferase
MTEAEVIKGTENGPITIEDLIQDLNALGVKPGMILIVHSSLSSIGWVSGGAVAVIQALEKVLGPEGTLVMPAFSGDLSDPGKWSNPPVPDHWRETIRQTMPAYDPNLTPTRGLGKIPETFRNQVGVIRSSHPQVSFAAYGKLADEITRDHQLDFGLGDNSPLGKIYQKQGWILLMGVGYQVNSSLHLAEYRATYPGKKEIVQGAPMLLDGKRQWVSINEYEEHSEMDFQDIGAAYHEFRGVVLEGKIGQANCLLISQKDLVDFGVDWMEKNRSIRS